MSWLRLSLILCIFAMCCAINNKPNGNVKYFPNREQPMRAKQSPSIGASIKLNGKEEIVNKLLMELKKKDVDSRRVDTVMENHFFKTKDVIEESEVFKLLRELPKGAALQCYDTCLINVDFLINATYTPNLYCCQHEKESYLKFHVFKTTPDNDECEWQLVSDLRKNRTDLDDFFRSQFTLKVDDPEKVYPTKESVITRYNAVQSTINSLISYKPILEKYAYLGLKALYDDNTRYVECRLSLLPVYCTCRKRYTKIEVTEIYYRVFVKFVNDYPDFYGKMIYNPETDVNQKESWKDIVDVFLAIKERHKEVIAGIELARIDQSGDKIEDYYLQLEQLKRAGAQYFYHNIYNCNNTKLVDALLLNPARIGNIEEIEKNKVLLNYVRDKMIGIEINPISDQVFKSVCNLNDHPASYGASQGLKIVVTAGKPSLFGTKGSSYDWYVSFMKILGDNSDLRTLKQLALNSLESSVLNKSERMVVMDRWQSNWDEFIEKFSTEEMFNKFNVRF